MGSKIKTAKKEKLMENQNPYQTPTGNLANDDGYGEINFFSPSSRIGRVRYLSHGMLAGLVFYVVLAIVMLVGLSAESGVLFWVVPIYATVISIHKINLLGTGRYPAKDTGQYYQNAT